MATQPAAKIGESWQDIDTPALVVDLDHLEHNLATMADYARQQGVRLRPHSKSHKCPAIAHQQIALGAVGVCCQKVSEAEVMVAHGILDILVSNQIIGRAKLNRLAALAKQAEIAVCVDNIDNIDEINDAAERFNVSIKVLVEVNVGSARCGVLPGQETLILAKAIAECEHLHFAGLQAYHGGAQHLRSFEARRRTILQAANLVEETVSLLAEHGFHCDIIGGGGTGTYIFEATSGIYNELQVGSYVFMDQDYSLNLNAQGEPIDEFKQSLSIKSAVLSKPQSHRCVLDAGLKAFSTDSGLPGIARYEHTKVLGAADEHTNIEFSKHTQVPEIGDAVTLLPSHCDPTVNLHDWLIGIRKGQVQTIWPVAARGALL
ncbi:DSD1 family PLP-dependent enzyme [Thalassotalea fonticola]|uniref:DSD1 family PLP-dependent enzyme n=1 Tax=Thalassotalea fonticola TaxID=3065649 RepID=A0ABZ0GIT5_9GAMM|nr:DSD1 family PLP-dependent enzyme [Colwelliaceae bacterium S1-1]